MSFFSLYFALNLVYTLLYNNVLFFPLYIFSILRTLTFSPFLLRRAYSSKEGEREDNKEAYN